MKSSSLHAIPPPRRCLAVTDSSGYLLSEVLIAIAIFSIGCAAVGNLILSTSVNNTSAHIITQATLLAAETIEALKMESITELAPGAYSDANNPIDAVGQNGGIFQRRWVIEDPIGYDTARRIRVTVSWNRRGALRSVELATITRGDGT